MTLGEGDGLVKKKKGTAKSNVVLDWKLKEEGTSLIWVSLLYENARETSQTFETRRWSSFRCQSTEASRFPISIPPQLSQKYVLSLFLTFLSLSLRFSRSKRFVLLICAIFSYTKEAVDLSSKLPRIIHSLEL